VTTPSTARPPAWAEAILRLLPKSSEWESVSGDLLEQYRDSVLPERGHARADAWYVMQVARFVRRTAWVWGVLLAASVIGRDTLDWWVSPTDEFYARSIASTAIAVSIFTCAGLSAAWRSRSIRAGALAGVATGAVAAVIIDAATLVQLAIWHDPHTMTMIKASGGLDEVFVLSLIVIVPGTVCATVGALLGKVLAGTSPSPVDR
jgi:hypothetical protein